MLYVDLSVLADINLVELSLLLCLLASWFGKRQNAAMEDEKEDKL